MVLVVVAALWCPAPGSRVEEKANLWRDRGRRGQRQHGSFVAGSWSTFPKHPNTVSRGPGQGSQSVMSERALPLQGSATSIEKQRWRRRVS